MRIGTSYSKAAALFTGLMAWAIGSVVLLSFSLVPAGARAVWLGSYAIVSIAAAALAVGIAGKASVENAVTVKLVLALILFFVLVSPFLRMPVVRGGLSFLAWGYLSAFLWLSVLNTRRMEVRYSRRGARAEILTDTTLLVAFVATYYLAWFILGGLQASGQRGSNPIPFAAALATVACLKGAQILGQKEVPKKEKAIDLVLLAELGFLIWSAVSRMIYSV